VRKGDCRISSPTQHSLDLPPLFRPVVLREVGDAFAHACAHAERLGAGTLVHVGRFDLAEFAVVFEPEEPLASARRAFYVAMLALAEALAALAPPEKPMAIDWPDAILVDGGLIGGGRLRWPERTSESEVPDWLVFGGMIRTMSMSERDPGLYPLATALEDEGFQEAGAERVVEGFARHLMAALDDWRERGFDAIARGYAARLRANRGAFCAIDATGDLLIRRIEGKVERRDLISALAQPSWLDPATGGPRR
jgi:biotin-(acetyl-CoA carboxylase) ligase